MNRSELVSRAAASLVRSSEEGQGRHVRLKGPFKRVAPYYFQGPEYSEVEVEDLSVDSSDFAEAAAGTTGQEHVEDYAGQYHTVVVEGEFSHTTPEPSVGWAGGTELESWEAIGLDGILLTNPEDRKALKAAIEDLVSTDGLVSSYDEFVADAAIDNPYD